MEPIRTLLADDHTLFRKGIRNILEQMEAVEVVGEAATGEQAVALAHELVPDVILMDIKMPRLGGIEATRAVLKENPHIGIILVTMFDDAESVFSGMRAGARGYVLKEAEPAELRRAIDAAHMGEVLLCPIIASKVLSHFGSTPPRDNPDLPYEDLTQRELEVLQLAAEGLSNKEIAARLSVREGTVKARLATIFRKLGCSNRVQLALICARDGPRPDAGTNLSA